VVGETDLSKLLGSMSPELMPDEYVFCSGQGEYRDFHELSPLASYREAEGLTLVVLKEVAIANKLPFESVFRVITLTIHSSLDAVGLTAAVSTKLAGKGISANVIAGQRCTASSRLIVTEGIHDAFVDAMVQRMQLLTVVDARASNTDIGPVVSEEQLTNNLDYLRIGAAEGAKHITGGDRVERATPGWYLSPALFVEAQREMRICREEIFGPISSVTSVTDYDEALAVANDADYGLSAGIVSNDRSKIDHFVANIQAGMAQVNLPTAGMDFHAPFTGRKGSSFGPPEKGSHCREFFTNSKVVHARYGEPYSTGKAGS
jgi:acyl-CoA reductase-like NAD-dependent aldehyde dehydrogenase